MNQAFHYIVQYNMQDITPGKPAKSNVIQHYFRTFDAAFAKLYSTDINYFDKQIAAANNLGCFVKDAMILREDTLTPVLTVERSFNPQDSYRATYFNTNATLYFTKGDTFDLLSADTRRLLRSTDPQLSLDRVYPFAVYSEDGTRLLRSGQRIKDSLHLGTSRPQDLPGYAYSVDTLRHTFLDRVPPGATNGTAVMERRPFHDLGEAMKTLFNVDLEIVDPLLSFNNNRHEFLTRMALTDLMEQRPIVELKNLRYVGIDAPEAGLYLEYASRIHRREVEEAVPALARLNGEGGSLTAAVATYDGERLTAIPTRELRALQASQPDNSKILLRRLPAPKTAVPSDGPSNNARPGIHQ